MFFMDYLWLLFISKCEQLCWCHMVFAAYRHRFVLFYLPCYSMFNFCVQRSRSFVHRWPATWERRLLTTDWSEECSRYQTSTPLCCFFSPPPPRIVSPLSHFKHSQSFIRCNFSLISLTSFPAISLPFAILGSFSSCVHSIQICLQFFCDSPNYFLILCIFHLFHRPLTFWL